MNFKRNFKKLKYEALYLFILLIRKITCALPRKVSLSIYSNLGKLAFNVFKKERAITIKNLSFVYGDSKSEEEILALAKNSWINLSKSIMEFIRYKNIKDLKDLDEYVEVKGAHYLTQAQNYGKGVLALTSHLGPFEMCLYYIAMKGYNIASTGSPLKHPKLQELMVENRSRNGASFFDRKKASIRIIRQLKAGNFMGVLIDQDSNKMQNTFIDFFGKKCATPSGPALMVLKTGAVVLPIHCYRTENDKLVIEVEKPRVFKPTGDLESDIQEVTQEMHNYTEKMIRRFPDQWVWMHDRWKTRPLNIERKLEAKAS
ncbi:lysophospholipid acyltransferase family protein [Sediminitomix flava]|uniref:KDO2-lipid IV(A) lauroyltransferase n=1 Tax=Sediminitomix flava TaxID=379075 RepID=A0A315Z9E1_SEDFL|nr:lysophospholipid acyltransferase family protein [Sediminitomix flava]PWJ42030.1 KDO2-lipid IV(A) lauroyltransferase [Sediminitomix flava]